jgi:copper oxidase (laccase) domain-containing protein
MATPDALNLFSNTKDFFYHVPNWDGPKNVKILVTTRLGGFSSYPYEYLNLGLHVNDDPQKVALNRNILQKTIKKKPIWLNQIHSSESYILA